MVKLIQRFINLLRDKKNEEAIKILRNKNKLHKKHIKNNNRKINIVFICHRPSVWNYQKSIFEACNNDENFNVTIVAIPNKKQLPGIGLNHEVYVSEGAEEFFKDFPCRVINGYNYEKKEWFDLKLLKPDYVFFQTPYNVCRPLQYNSKIVSQYAQICYFHYGFPMLKEESVIKDFAKDFIQYAYMIFAESEFHKKHYIEELRKHNKFFDFNKVYLTGQTAFDGIEKFFNSESSLWKHKNHERFRILRTPRWCTNENNCTFLEYKDILFNYCENNDCDYIFRPHPQALIAYVSDGIMTQEEIDNMISQYNNSKNCTIDLSKKYLKTLYSSDVLISDPSGIMFEYLMTGKPIIYTEKSNDWANDFAKEVILEGSYRAKNKEELINTIEMLKRGEDPLKEKRQQIIKDNFYINQQGAGYTIKELIKRDFYGKD